MKTLQDELRQQTYDHPLDRHGSLFDEAADIIDAIGKEWAELEKWFATQNDILAKIEAGRKS